jgi:hypothetical protein
MNEDLAFVLVIAVPALLFAFLPRTLRWLPGVIVIAGALAAGSMIDTDPHGDVGGIGAFGAAVQTLEMIALLVLGVILLFVGASSSARPQPSPLPVATEVAGVNKPD